MKRKESDLDGHDGITRRGFLKAGALTGAAVAGGGTAAAYAGRARPEQFVEPEPELPRRLSESKRVIVVGGGLAGLSAAIELAERGFEVELFESGSDCGGRAGGYDARVGGEERRLDHGFHGFFFQYYNLRDLLARTTDRADFLPIDAYPVAPKGHAVDVFHANTLPFPFNLLNVMVDSKNLDFASAASGGVGQVVEMLSYDPIATYERLDGTDFASWAKSVRIPDSLYQCLFEPYVRTMFVRPDEVSAAEIMQLFHSYFIANPEGMGMDVLRRPFLDALVEPLVAHLTKLAGRVHTSAPVHALAIENGEVRGVVRRSAGEPRSVGRVAIADIPEQGYKAIQTEIGLVFVKRDAAGVVALSAACSHMGCPVGLNREGSGFLCPCHGGRYDGDGRPTGGPPKRPLVALEAIIEGDEVALRSSVDSKEEVIAADYVVLATDVGGIRKIAKATTWPTALHDWTEQVDELSVCRPYSVARQWLDTPLQPDRHALYTAGGYEVLDELFCFSQYHEQEMEWARRHGGSVIETHCYAIKDELVSDPERVHDIALEEAASIVPELGNARVVHREIQLLQDFSDHPVNSQARRPRTETPLANLLLAGDWVRIDLPLELMERAATSGRLAANAILQREGVRRVGIRTPPLRGILASG
jgi:isorenieratene synthase